MKLLSVIVCLLGVLSCTPNDVEYYGIRLVGGNTIRGDCKVYVDDVLDCTIQSREVRERTYKGGAVLEAYWVTTSGLDRKSEYVVQKADNWLIGG
jgi:hypothetical protein